MNALLEVEALSIRFPREDEMITAVHGVSFDLFPGEILGLVGESGAGKSLTGMALVGLVSPPAQVSAASIRLDGRRIDNLGPRELRRVRGKDIGVIFQDPLTSLDPLFTIGDQLVETIRCHLPVTSAEASERGLDLLRQVGIPAPERRFHDYPHQLSGGMRQRVVIALTLAAEPRVIVADEPTTALDVSVQAQIIGLIRRLCDERGTSIILITHDMGVVAEITDRVAVMYAGRIVETGPTEAILNRPCHPYTRGLMGAIPVVGGEKGQLVQIPGAMPRPGALPEGCAFAPRCTGVAEPCRRERPQFSPTVSGAAACHFPVEDAA